MVKQQFKAKSAPPASITDNTPPDDTTAPAADVEPTTPTGEPGPKEPEQNKPMEFLNALFTGGKEAK
jgi:hypothetical protein